jgi:hypothetical protein
MQESDLLLDYAPRRQFVPFHQRSERFACIVTHRRAGKTVACIQDLQRGATVAGEREAPFDDPAAPSTPTPAVPGRHAAGSRRIMRCNHQDV